MKPIFPIFFLIALLCSCDKSISDFQSENFVKYFGTGYESRGYDVIELTDGSYALTGVDYVEGTDYQIFVAMVNKYGNQIWNNSYGLSEVHEEGRIIKEAPDGLLIAGVSDSAGFSRPFILKAGPAGDSLWYRSFGSADTDIDVQDIVLDETHIYVAGYALQAGNSGTNYYTAKLTVSGDPVWERNYYVNSGSMFSRIFLLEENILLVGDDGNEDRISIVTVAKGSGNPVDFTNLELTGETLADALLSGDALYVLANVSGGTLLYKLNSGYKVDWQTAAVSAVTGKAVVQQQEGAFLILGESTAEGNKLITAISIDDSGVATYGPDLFRTIPGTISRVRSTTDNGLIIIGSTNATYGINAQLIKTDANLFLLKP